MKMEQTGCFETSAYKNSDAGKLLRTKHTTNTNTLPWRIHSSEICRTRKSIITLAIDYTIWNTILMGLEERYLHSSIRIVFANYKIKANWYNYCTSLLQESIYRTTFRLCYSTSVIYTENMRVIVMRRVEELINMERRPRNLRRPKSHRTWIVLMGSMSGEGRGCLPTKLATNLMIEHYDSTLTL
jgi:hypothetical protein